MVVAGVASIVALHACGTGGREPATEGGPRGVEEIVAVMSLEEKVGQLLMLHVYGSSIDDERDGVADANRRIYGVGTIREALDRHTPGGVIFIERNPLDAASADVSTRNLVSLDQITRLTTQMQTHAEEQGWPGLLIATDHEQGPITRLPPPASELAGGARLGATGDASLAEDNAHTTGRELLDVGVNVNLAPVADVGTNPDNPVIGERSFGSDPDLVARMTAAQIRGYQRAGIAATAKHFPGHGAADLDSHLDLPVIDIPAEEWRDRHLPPFAAAIDGGVDAIMTAHVAAPALDPSGAPATLSRAIIGDLLRGDMAFDGVVITDALWMRGVRHGRDDADVAIQALAAGADILLMPPDADEVSRAVVDAVRAGDLSAAALDRSVQRILALKRRLGLLAGSDGDDA